MIPPHILIPTVSIPHRNPRVYEENIIREQKRIEKEDAIRQFINELYKKVIPVIATFPMASDASKMDSYKKIFDFLYEYVPEKLFDVLNNVSYFLKEPSQVNLLLYIILYLSEEYDFLKKVQYKFSHLDELHSELNSLRDTIIALNGYERLGKKKLIRKKSYKRI
jgi:hypothetical protein